jgi:hypothetical protein
LLLALQQPKEKKKKIKMDDGRQPSQKDTKEEEIR